MQKIYLSGPLFSRADIAWGGRVKSFLEDRLDDISILWPHEIVPCTAGMQEIFQANLRALGQAEMMVSLLDGPQVDDGTAWEIGYAYARGLPIIGLRTDFRQAGDTAHSVANAMVECACVHIYRSADELLVAAE